MSDLQLRLFVGRRVVLSALIAFALIAARPTMAQVAVPGSAAKATETQAAVTIRPELVVRASSVGLLGQRITVSPNGDWYARLARSGQISIVSTKDGIEFQRFTANQYNSRFNYTYNVVAISADSKTLAIPFMNGHIQRFDVNTTHALPDIQIGDGSSVLWIAYHPQEDILATVLDSGAVYLIRGSDGKVLFQSALRAALSTSFKIFFSASGNELLGLSENEAILWNWREKKQLWAVDSHALHSDNLGRIVLRQQLSPQGIFPVQESAEKLGLFHFAGAAFSPSGKSVALVHDDEVSLVEVETGRKSATIPIPYASCLSALFLDENRIFVGTVGEGVIYDIAAKTSVRDQIGRASCRERV